MTASERIREARSARKSNYQLAAGDTITGRDIDGVTRTGTITFATNHHLVLGDYVVPRERATQSA